MTKTKTKKGSSKAAIRPPQEGSDFNTSSRNSALERELAETRSHLAKTQRELGTLLELYRQPLVMVDDQMRITRFNEAAREIFYLTEEGHKRDIATIHTHIPLPSLVSSLESAINNKHPVKEEIRTSEEIYTLTIHPYLNDRYEPMGALITLKEKTDLIQAERERSSIGYIAQLFMAYDDLDDFYRELPRLLSQRLNFPYALLELFDGEHEQTVLVGSWGLERKKQTKQRNALPNSVAGWVIQTGGTYLSGQSAAKSQLASPPLNGSPIETLVAAPLRVKDAVLGVITLADHRKREVTDNLVETLEVVGINAGLGIERRRSQQTVMEATTEVLLESLERYRKIVDTANEGIWIVDQSLRTEFANPQMAHMLGYQIEEIRGKSAFNFIPLSDRKEALHKWRRTHEGLQESSDWRLLRKDGSHLWAQISTSPIYDDEGLFRGALGMVADITHRKKAEQELLDHRQKLRALASELTMVEERERRRIASDLHDGVGHSLAACKLRLDMLMEAAPEQRKMINSILEVLDQTITTTRSLISDLSPPVLHEMGLATALEWLADRVHQMSGISVIAQVEAPTASLNDETEVILFRAASELLTNVVKHSGAKQAQVSLREDSNKLWLVVEDDGKGFDQGQIKMDSFGLFSIRERLSFLGGRLAIDSGPGRGTTAALTLELGTLEN
jgi:PAS domain S-box-containing protein